MACRVGRSRAFSLIELVIVVVIMAVIGAIAVPKMTRAGDGAAASAFAREIRGLAQAARLYKARSGGWGIDSATGTAPVQMASLIGRGTFGRPTPLGGQWDFERDDNGIGYGVGVVFSGTAPTAKLLAVDRLLDDGDLSTGGFREIASGRYYLVLEN